MEESFPGGDEGKKSIDFILSKASISLPLIFLSSTLLSLLRSHQNIIKTLVSSCNQTSFGCLQTSYHLHFLQGSLGTHDLSLANPTQPNPCLVNIFLLFSSESILKKPCKSQPLNCARLLEHKHAISSGMVSPSNQSIQANHCMRQLAPTQKKKNCCSGYVLQSKRVNQQH